MRERRWRIHRWWSSAPCQLKMSEKDVVALLTSGAMTRNRLPSAATPQSVAMHEYSGAFADSASASETSTATRHIVAA